MKYLIYEIYSSHVEKIVSEEPVNLSDKYAYIACDLFKEGDEKQNLITVDVREGNLFSVSIYKLPEKFINTQEEITELKSKLAKAEADNLTTLEALAEVYEMFLDLQALQA